jgi:hypothetical protein
MRLFTRDSLEGMPSSPRGGPSEASLDVQMNYVSDDGPAFVSPPDNAEAKRFDLLMLHLQLTVLHVEPGFERLKEKVRAIVGSLEEKAVFRWCGSRWS